MTFFFCKHSPSFKEDQFRNKYGQDHLALLTNEGFVIKSECTNLIQKDWSTLQEINENNKDKINKYLYNKTWMIHKKTFYQIASHLRLDILLIYQHKKSEKNKECTESTFLHQTSHVLSIVRRVTSRIIVKLSRARFKYMFDG